MTLPPDDPRARFAEFYEPVAPALRAWSVLRCRGLEALIDADDLVQETCLEAFRAMHRFDATRGTFRNWIFGVATLVASAAMRRTARRAAAVRVDALEFEPLALATTISRRVRRDESLTRFLRAADELDETDRSVLVHRGLEGMPHSDVATLLGLSMEMVSKRWHRLRERLRELPAARDLLDDA